MSTPAESLEPDARKTAIWGERWELIYALRISGLYHQKRERFFDTWDKVSKAVAVIGGAAAVSQLVSDPENKAWTAAVVSILSTFSLVFGFAQKSRRHGELARDFLKLLARLEEAGPYPEFEKLDKFKSERVALEASEPAAMNALVRHCENLFRMGSGETATIKPLSLWQRCFMNYWDFSLQGNESPSAGSQWFWRLVAVVVGFLAGWATQHYIAV